MECFDMLLVLPTTDDVVRSVRAQEAAPAYGLNVLATYLRLHGMCIFVLDEFMMNHDPVLKNKGWKEAITELLKRCNVKSLGLSVLTNFVSTVRELIDAFHDMPIILGGVHITSMDDDSIRLFGANLYLKGHINEQMLEEIDRLIDGGKPDQMIVVSRDDAPVCCPDYTQYLPYAPFKKITSRISAGCRSAGCNFCCAYWLDPHPRVYPNIEDILCSLPLSEETSIEFHDSDFVSLITPDMVALLKEYLLFKPKVYCHARMESITPDRLKLMSTINANFKIFVGLESASPALCASMNKKRTNNAYEVFLHTLSECNFTNITYGFFTLFGVPEETLEDIDETIAYLKSIERLLGTIDVRASIVNVIPGSVYYKRLVKSGVINNNPWWDRELPLLTAVNGEELNNALQYWNLYAEAFPQMKKHNSIFATLLNKLGVEIKN